MARPDRRSSEPQKSDPGVTDKERTAVTDAVTPGEPLARLVVVVRRRHLSRHRLVPREWVDGTIPA